MKVLQINSVCGRLSTGRIASGIQSALMENGNQCSIAYGYKNAVATEYDYHIGNEFSRNIHAGLSRVFDNTGFASSFATRKLIKYIEKYSPDIIHLHNLHGYYLNVEILFEFLKKYNKPVVWTLHDCWSFTGHCAHFDFIGCDKWKTGCFDCPQKNRYPASLLSDNSKRNYARKKELFTSLENLTIVTPSEWLADLVKVSFLGKYPVKVLPNGIDTSVFHPCDSDLRKQYGLENKKILLGVASAWDDRKGLKDFVKLSKKLDSNFSVILIGITESDREKLSDCPIIAFPATDSAQALAQWYSTADFFVNLTYEDNFPTVNLEALACGTPVITYKTGGSAECLNETCGCSVKQGDINLLLEKIKTSEFFSDDCYNKGSLYDSRLRNAQYLKLYNQLI